jgi:hypothetical protein
LEASVPQNDQVIFAIFFMQLWGSENGSELGTSMMDTMREVGKGHRKVRQFRRFYLISFFIMYLTCGHTTGESTRLRTMSSFI